MYVNLHVIDMFGASTEMHLSVQVFQYITHVHFY